MESTTSNTTNGSSATQVQNLQRNAVVLSVTAGRLRTTKKVASSSVTCDADPTVYKVSKQILESTQLDAISKHMSQAHAYVSKVSLPSPFKSGMFLVPVGLLKAVTEELDQARAILDTLVADFMTWYSKAYAYAQLDENAAAAMVTEDPTCAEFAEWKEKLGSLWEPADFPTPPDVRDRFFLEYQVLELQTPGKLKAISKELYQREAEKIQNVWAQATEKITSVLMEEFAGMTAHMVERLTPGEDGKKKIFRASLTEKLMGWMELFDQRKLTNDEQLKAIVEKARKIVQGIDLDSLRESDDMRAQIAQSFTEIKAELDQAVVNKPQRRLDFAPEGE